MGLGQNPYRGHSARRPLRKFRPVNLDVLPLYIVLQAAFPVCPRAAVRWPVGGDRGLARPLCGDYATTTGTCPPIPTSKVWYFNSWPGRSFSMSAPPAAVLGRELAWLDRFRWPLGNPGRPLPAVLGVYRPVLALQSAASELIPAWIARQIYPIDKTNIDILRFLHFLALAWLVRLVVPADTRLPALAGLAATSQMR